MHITLLETNSDIIYAQRGDGPAWCLGTVTPDMHGQFAADAAAWAAGDWEPGPHNGQDSSIPGSEVDAAGLVVAATWDSGSVTVAGDPGSLGAGARLYLTAP